MIRKGTSIAYHHERIAVGARARLERLAAAAATSRASVAAAAELELPAGDDLVKQVPELLFVGIEAADGDVALDELLTDLLLGDEAVDGEGADGEHRGGEEAELHLGGVPVDAVAGASLDVHAAGLSASRAYARGSREIERMAVASGMPVAQERRAEADDLAAELAELDVLAAELARLARSDAAGKAAAEAGRTWSAVQDAPPALTRLEAVAPKPSRKSQRCLVSLTRLWHLWRIKVLATDGVEIARAGGEGPTWLQACCRAACCRAAQGGGGGVCAGGRRAVGQRRAAGAACARGDSAERC